jgi:DNA repair exonuclease SbcCD ATPase subunit
MKLKMENFQGVRSADYQFDGNNAKFYGDNGAGKTTLLNAYTWLLFGKASDGSANFSPKPRKGDEDVHNVNTAVEMTFTHNGEEHTIARVFSEVRKKKRGNAQAEFGGHETAYFTDGVPVRESDFSQFLAGIAPPEQFKILTFPLFFSNELDWTARRKILFDACGNLSDADVIASNKELAGFAEMLGKNTTDDFKKIVAAAMKRTNEQLNSIPGRIDEATRAIPETSGTEEKINAALSALNTKKAAQEQKRADMMNGDLFGSAIRKSISEKETEIAEARARHLRRSNEATETIYPKLTDAQKKKTEIIDSMTAISSAINRAEQELADINSRRETVKADYAAVQDEAFDEKSTACPTCGRDFPAENIEQLKAEYNQRKDERLEAILDIGKRTASKEMVAAKEHEIEAGKAELEQMVKMFEAAEAEVKTLNGELTAKTGTLTAFENTAEYDVLNGELNTLKAQSSDDTQAKSATVSSIDAEIAETNAEIKVQFELLAAHTTASTQRTRIDELKAQEEELGAEYIEQERKLYLCELFIKTKVTMLDERINGKFKTVRFRLFQEQINGGLKECCDALIPTKEGNLVTWNGAANYAAKVNAGLEIISTLSEYWGIEVPVWFDNAESVTQLLPVTQQIITLAVRGGESKLKLEKGI